MLFSSITFLFYFLPIVLAVYFAVPRRARNSVLLGASLLFYTWCGGAMVLLLLVSMFADYFCGGLAAKALQRGDERSRRFAVAGSIA